MLRQNPPLKLRRSPLVMVLAQVRFSPVLKMADYVPAIQEELRRKGYPRFRALTTREIVFGPTPEFRQSERWVFLDKERTQSVVLANDFVVLETSRYSIFEDFVKSLEVVLRIVGDVTATSLVQRIGLRFVDLILPEDRETLDEYLRPNLRGHRPHDLAIEKVLNQFESRGITPVGQLIVRLHQNDDGDFLPPDLKTDELSFPSPPEQGAVVTLLDIDHFSQEDRDYDIPTLVDAMWALHDYTDKAFLTSVTETALERWGREA